MFRFNYNVSKTNSFNLTIGTSNLGKSSKAEPLPQLSLREF